MNKAKKLAPVIQMETLSQIQNLLIYMDIKMEEANLTLALSDRKEQARVAKAAKALIRIRREVNEVFG